MYLINEQVEITIDRSEANFDRASDSAYSMAVGMFGIDEDGHSSNVEGWERSSSWIEVVFDTYLRHGHTHLYAFVACPRKAESADEDATDFGAELQRQIDASPELAEAVFEASVEIDRESVRYKELKKRVLEWLREKRDEDGTGCCYGLKTIADEMKCTMGELVDWDNDYGVLFDLGREGNISWTAGQDCVYAVGGRTTWDEF